MTFIILGISTVMTVTGDQPEWPDSGDHRARSCGRLRGLDGELEQQPFVAGSRFTIADITACCAIEFARGLMRFQPGQEGMRHLQAWRDRIAARPSASA
jgi:glutathione S-transferase